MSETTGVQLDPKIERRLRVAVERAVRPVFDGELNKLKVRRELLDHLVESCRAGMNAGEDPSTAADAAIARMGDPAALTAEVQAGVTLAGRIAALNEWAVRRPCGGSHARHAAWMACLMGGMMGALLLASSTMAEFGFGPDGLRFRPVVIRMMAFLVTSFGVVAAAGAWFGGRVRDTLEAAGNRVGLRALLLATAAGLSLAVVGSVMWLAVGWPAVPWSGQFARSWAALSVIFAAATIALSWLDIREREPIEQWLALDLSGDLDAG
ncbi:MAG: hypothetical protein AAF805_02580 [Planctomycetota bacterium]